VWSFASSVSGSNLALNIVLVGSEDKQLEEMLRASVFKVSTADLTTLITRKTAPPDVIVIDVRRRGLPPQLAAARRAMPSVAVIAVAAELDPAMMLEAIRSGVNEFLTEPVTEQDVRQALERVANLRPGPPERKVFAFLGAKGGVGTTTIATNVATALAQNKSARVLLLDLHPAYGDAALFFGAEPRFSVLDALENTHRLDEAYLKGLVVRTKAGLDLLASSDRSVVGSIDAQRVRTLIDFVTRHYTHVVLDVPRSDSAALDALEGTTKIVIVANQELSTVRGAARMATTLRQRYGKDRVQVVVSRYDTASAIAQQDVERATGGAIHHTFPSDYRLAVDALNRGCPLVVENHSKLAGSLTGFARALAGMSEKSERPSKPTGLLGRLTGRT
jgi:pilus assembly protein CpaE